jgi:hypothetical protein
MVCSPVRINVLPQLAVESFTAAIFSCYALYGIGIADAKGDGCDTAFLIEEEISESAAVEYDAMQHPME